MSRTKTLEKLIEEVKNTDLTKLSDTALLKLHTKAYDIYVDWYSVVWATEPVSLGCEKFLEKKLGAVSPEDFAILTALTKTSFSQEIEEDFDALVELAKKVDGDFKHKDLARSITQFQQNYFWMYNNYFETRVVQEEDVILDIKKRLTGTKKPAANKANIAKAKEALIKKLKLDEETKEVLHISNEFIYWQDMRKKWIMIYAHYLDLLLEEFGRRANISIKDMRYTMPEELKDILKGKKLPFAARQKNCLIVLEEGV